MASVGRSGIGRVDGEALAQCQRKRCPSESDVITTYGIRIQPDKRIALSGGLSVDLDAANDIQVAGINSVQSRKCRSCIAKAKLLPVSSSAGTVVPMPLA